MNVRLGIIGCGLMGRLHAETIRLLPRAEVVAVCDIKADAAERLVADYAPDATIVSEPGALIDDFDLQGLLICTHHDTHYHLTMSALQAGMHVFVEKPMAPTVPECREMCAAAQGARRHVVVGFFARFAPAVQEVKAANLRPIATVAQMSSARWGEDFWAQAPGIGGGNVFSQGCHLLDLCCYLQGEAPVAVTAQGGTLTHPQGPIDTVAGTFRYPSGAVASLFISDGGLSPYAGKVMVQLFCVDQAVAIHHLFGGERGQAVWWQPVGSPNTGMATAMEWDTTGHRSLIRDFVTTISEGRLVDNLPTAIDGLRATALIEALFTATKNGNQEVRILS